MQSFLFPEMNNEDRPDDPQEWYIKQKDKSTFDARVRRLKYLHKLNPEGKQLMGNAETINAYREMQWCYIEGFYISVIVLAQSLIEKILEDCLRNTKGITKKEIRSITSMLDVIKRKKLLDDFWVMKIDRLRKIRNPITHLRYFGDPETIDVRALEVGNKLEKQLEIEAKDALEVATHFSLCGLNRLF